MAITNVNPVHIPLQNFPAATQPQSQPQPQPQRRRSRGSRQYPTAPPSTAPPSTISPAQQRGVITSAGIWLWENIMAFFYFIAAIAGLVGTWLSWPLTKIANQLAVDGNQIAEDANQIARAALAFEVIQYCAQDPEIESSKILCATPVDINSIAKEIAKAQQTLAQVAARSVEYTSAAVMNHNTMCNRGFRLMLSMPALLIHGANVLISRMQCGTSRFQTSVRKYFTYTMATFMLLRPSMFVVAMGPNMDYYIDVFFYVFRHPESKDLNQYVNEMKLLRNYVTIVLAALAMLGNVWQICYTKTVRRIFELLRSKLPQNDPLRRYLQPRIFALGFAPYILLFIYFIKQNQEEFRFSQIVDIGPA